MEDCEYIYCKYNGEYIVNICTYRDDNVEAEIRINGNKAGKTTDLIEMKDFSDSIEISAYTPVLIRAGK